MGNFFIQYLAIGNIVNVPNNIKTWQSRFKTLANTKQALKMAKNYYNFFKSGRTVRRSERAQRIISKQDD